MGMYRRYLFFFMLCLLSLPWPVASSLREDVTVYRLVRPDGVVVAYTELPPAVGDIYWHAEEDVWYHVVRVEGNIGWVEVSPTLEASPQQPVWPYMILFIGGLLVVFLLLRRNKLRN